MTASGKGSKYMNQPVKHGPEQKKAHELPHQAIDQEPGKLGARQHPRKIKTSFANDADGHNDV